MEIFANGLRSVLGLCPLYGPDTETDYRVEHVERTSPRRPMRIGIAGVVDVYPNVPTRHEHPRERISNAIGIQIARDKYRAKSRVTVNERQADDDRFE